MSVEKTIAKLYDLKRNPRLTTKIDGRTKEKKEVYIADFRHQGKRYQIYARNISDFFVKIDEAVALLQKGSIQGSDKIETNIQQVFDDYLQNHRLSKLQEYSERKKQEYYKDSFQQLARLLDYFYKIKRIVYFHEVTQELMRETITLMQKSNLKNSSINRYIEAISAVISYVKNNTNIKYSDFNISKFKLKQPPPMTNYLTDDQIAKLIEFSPEHLRNIVQFLLYTGFRKQNAFNLTWDNIDLERRIITVKVKQNKTHTVPIISKLYDLLLRLKQESVSEYVFTYKGKQIKDAKKSFRTAFTKAEINLPDGQAFHVLRHTAATILINKGVDIGTVQQVLGHSSPAMTQKYAHLSTNKILQDMERVFQ